MRNNQNILTPLQLHDDRLEPNHHIPIALPAPVSIIILIVISRFEVFWVFLRDLGVGQPVADTRVELVERFPLQLVVGGGEVGGGCDGAFEGRGPDCKGPVVAHGLADEFWELECVLLAALGELRVPADLPGEVVHGLAVLGPKC
jgi:hypothetical protein